jgi:feruloyl esterase
MNLRLIWACWAASGLLFAQTGEKKLVEADCTAERLGSSIPVGLIDEPVAAINLSAPVWKPTAAPLPAYCSIDGSMAPVETGGKAKPILFRVLLPAEWSERSAQLGGGGMNGMIPSLTMTFGVTTGSGLLERGFATYGSDSGHTMAGTDWALSDESIKNLGYMQLKKTHDAAMVLIQRVYGQKPRFNYFFGTSQGGREALTVAQRYPADYDGIIANVPIVSFSSLMLAPELIRIQEEPLANWVTPAKVNAIRGEFVRQCDKLDGLADGIINNYMGCRAIFDMKQGKKGRDPWAAKRCPGNHDPDPSDTSAKACLTEGQISTLEMVYSPYLFATPLANGVKQFGMWVPNTDPNGSGLILPVRFRGQEGAAPDAPMHRHLGVIGVTGFLMQDPAANPLDYVEGGKWNRRRIELSEWLDATNPDLSKFAARGGKMIVTIGTNDTLASPGAQLGYFQSVIDRMGREKVDQFARFFVIPQTSHGLSGMNYATDGDGKTIEAAPIPNTYDRLPILMDWVEKKEPPPKQLTVTGRGRSLPLCNYPLYPKYVGGLPGDAGSYTCAR